MRFKPCEAEAWAAAIERLRGYQVLSFSEAFERLGGTDEEANPDDWERLLKLLSVLGYEWQWVRNRETGFVQQLFVRRPWPGDSLVWRGMGMTAYEIAA